MVLRKHKGLILIRNEVVTVDVGGTLIYPDSINITMGVGKGYNTATISGTSLVGSEGDSVTITMNGEVHAFLVNEKHYGKQDGVTFDCVGLPAVLEDERPSDEDFQYADSDELIETSRGSVAVVNNIPTIDFTGQTYSKTSTPMSRILDMVSVIGGEAYEIDGTLQLNPIAQIPDVATPIIIDEPSVFDFSYSANRPQTIIAKEVLINPVTDDIYAESNIVLDYTDGEGRGELYFTPSLSSGVPYTIAGVTAREAVTSERLETFQLEGETVIKTLAGIDTIVYMMTDEGVEIDPALYTLYAGYNVIRFHDPITDGITIKYQTQSVTVYPTVTTRIIVTYDCALLDIILEILEPMFSGSCSINVVDTITYENGGHVEVSNEDDFTFIFIEARGATNLVTEKVQSLAGGGTLTIKYLYTTVDWADTSFMNAISSETKAIIEILTGEVIYDALLDEYVVFLDKPIDSINDIYYGNQILSGFTYVDTGAVPYISFLEADLGKGVSISANITIVDITIPAPTLNHPATILDIVGCGGVTSTELSHAEDTLCDLPATFNISISGAFNKEIVDVIGKILTGDFGTLTVDSFGNVTVTVTTEGVYSILCDSVASGGVITVDSVGVV